MTESQRRRARRKRAKQLEAYRAFGNEIVSTKALIEPPKARDPNWAFRRHPAGERRIIEVRMPVGAKS